MKLITQNKPQVILLKAGFRPAGSSVINGKNVTWGDADQIIGIPLETDRIMKYTIEPSCVKSIYTFLEDVCWGTLLELTIRDKMVINIEILSDWLSHLEIF